MTDISTSASVFVPRPREEVFAVATDSTNAPRTLRSRGPFAGIRVIEMHEGQTLATGAKRRIPMTDGAVLEEVILDYDPPVRHRYGWAGGVKPPMSLLVRSGTGVNDMRRLFEPLVLHGIEQEMPVSLEHRDDRFPAGRSPTSKNDAYLFPRNQPLGIAV